MTNEEIITLVRKAQELGRHAGEEQLAKLQHAGPRWIVRDEIAKKDVGTMLDVCGFASMTIPGRSPIVKTFKQLSPTCNLGRYVVEGLSISKAYKRGYNLNLHMGFRQEMSVNEASVKAASDYLNDNGLECEWNSRID